MTPNHKLADLLQEVEKLYVLCAQKYEDGCKDKGQVGCGVSNSGVQN